MFTRQHYELIAKIFQYERLDVQDGASPESSVERLVEQFAIELETDNPIFNREKFIKDCGGGQ